LIEEKRATGVTLTALGFGLDNLNDDMMERVSNAGNGIYGVITDEDHAIEYVHERMLSTLVHVAKDLKIQVEMNPEHVVAYRLLGYENRAIADEDFRVDAVDAGEVGAGHRVTALYELVLTGEDVPNPTAAPAIVQGDPVDGDREIGAAELVRVKVRYKQPGATAEDPAREIARSLSPEEVSTATGDDDLRYAAAVASLAELARRSPFATTTEIDAIETIVLEQQRRDDERTELAQLWARIETLLRSR
jgi:Ca-activated chloride channel family protein